MKLDPKQLDAVLAGLRCLQQALETPVLLDVGILDIHTNHGRHSGLSALEIDALCEQLNS